MVMKLPLALGTGICTETVFLGVWKATMKPSNQSSVLACKNSSILSAFWDLTKKADYNAAVLASRYFPQWPKLIISSISQVNYISRRRKIFCIYKYFVNTVTVYYVKINIVFPLTLPISISLVSVILGRIPCKHLY